MYNRTSIKRVYLVTGSEITFSSEATVRYHRLNDFNDRNVLPHKSAFKKEV